MKRGRPVVSNRLVRLALIDRYGYVKAAKQLHVTPEALYYWMKQLRKREGARHLPSRLEEQRLKRKKPQPRRGSGIL